MKINNVNNQNFKGANLGGLSKALYTLGNNDMLNASFVDVFAMDTPRTIVEFNNRGKEAGIEMGFREYTGTFIAEFSAAVFALFSSKIFSKFHKPEVKINSNSWATNNSLDTFNSIYKNSDKTTEGFVDGFLSSVSGISGKETKNLASKSKTEIKPLKDKIVELISNKDVSKNDFKNNFNSVHDGLVNLLGADNNVKVAIENSAFSSNMQHVLRDAVDLGQNVFFKEGINDKEAVISKLKTMNKVRTGFAIPLSMGIALTNQYVNRMLTKKRTGIDNFVGENDYEQNVKDKNQSQSKKGLLAKKVLSAGIFLAMLTKVMNVKKPSDLVNKLEFTGPATGGNAIKTIYGTLILGRIFASKDETELRETNVRDYLGFLNWLVLGGFVAKGAAQAMDKNRQNLFNVTKDGKGIKHWLQDVSLKSQKEIIAQGGNVKSNLRKLNIAQMAGIGYSALMLGVLLPKLNIWMTKRGKKEDKNIKNGNPSFQSLKFEDFLYKAKMNSHKA